MNSQGLLLIAVAVGVLMLAVYLTSSIIENENGGISAAVRTIGIGLAIWSFIRPKVGLFIISIEAFSLDYVKKFAVYYGTVSTGTIIEVLIVGMLAVVGTVGGFLIQSVALRRYKLPPLLWVIFGVAMFATAARFFEGRKTVGFEKAGEDAFNCCVYIAIALPVAMTMVTRKQMTNLLNVQFFLCTLWAVWGIKQYYTGFTPMEWFYAETGLSAVASDHMIRVHDVRPFGFGSGVPNYSVLGPYFCYGAWQVWHRCRRRFLMTVCTLVLFWGIVTSLQRTIFLLPLLVLVLFYCLQTMRRSVIAYVSGFLIFATLVAFSQVLYNNLDTISSNISVGGYWGENMLTLGTFSDRLYSWTNLRDPKNYSLFGLDEELLTHDIFSTLLGSYGVVGLFIILGGMTWIAWFVLRTLLRVENFQDKQFAIFCMSVTGMTIILGFANGANFTANPVNLALWSFFAVAISTVVNSQLAPEPTRQSVQALLKALEASKQKIPMAAQVGLAQKEA